MKQEKLLKIILSVFVCQALEAQSPPPPEGTNETPATPSDTAATVPDVEPPAETSKEVPDDVKALEAKARASGLLNSEEDPGTALDPEEQFARVPLRPPMTDRTWRKWGGPALDKSYRIHRGDTLWKVSEILFGNPYLWPKVWQLNAHLNNPHVVFPGYELQFLPGNPNSAPELAFKNIPGVTTDNIPIVLVSQNMSLLERIEDVLKKQQSASQPPFRDFLLDDKPSVEGKLKISKNSEREFLSEGMSFETNAEDGRYAVVTVEKIGIGIRRAYKVHWSGNAEVYKSVGHVTKSYTEIDSTNVLVKDDFNVPAFSVHEEDVAGKALDWVGVQQGSENFSSQYQLVGARFKASAGEPSEGALVKLKQGTDKSSTLLLIRRSGRYGTFWVVENEKEIDLKL